VRLSAGEAFFTVSKDPARPFVVETPGGAVRVTGTVFDVRSETAADLTVAVVEGSVQVRPGEAAGGLAAGAVGLTAGEQLSAVGGGVTRGRLSTADMDEALAWRQGRVVFRNVPLRDALQRFARFHGRKIIPSAAVIASAGTVGSRYSLDDLEGFLEALKSSHELQVDHEAGGVIRVRLNRER
jgi:transmembrane sensor